jgi:hypothetical protein
MKGKKTRTRHQAALAQPDMSSSRKMSPMILNITIR